MKNENTVSRLSIVNLQKRCLVVLVFLRRVEAGTLLSVVPERVADDDGLRVERAEVEEQVHQCAALLGRAGVTALAVLAATADVADTDRVGVVA